MEHDTKDHPAIEDVAARTHLPKTAVLVFARLDPVALGGALGLASGLWVFLATIVLVLKGGRVVGPNLYLLSHYFVGYRIDAWGSVLGFVYASVFGFLVGFVFAGLRNFLTHTYLIYLRRRAEREAMSDMLDQMT